MTFSLDELTAMNDELIKNLQESEKYNNISRDISNSYLWVVAAVGIPGNVLTIITIITMQSLTSATFFVALLAFSDGSAIVAKLIGRVLSQHHVAVGSAGCKLYFLAPYFTSFANWVLILICGERFIAVCYPLKKVYLVTKRRCYILSALIAVILLVIFAGFYSVLRTAGPDNRECITSPELQKLMKAWYWINACLYLFIPFVFIVSLTVAIIRGLRRSRKDRRSILRSSTNTSDVNKKMEAETERIERTITIMLVVTSIVFLLLALPACVFYLTYSTSEDLVTEAKWQLFKQLQHVFLDSSHAINFFLYFIVTRRFRMHLISLLTCRAFPRHKAAAGTTPSTASNATAVTRVMDHTV